MLIHAGDVTVYGELDVIEDFNEWLRELPHQHKLVIPGNHDICWEREPKTRELITNAKLLVDESVEIDGVKFYGSPFSPWISDIWVFGYHPLSFPWDRIPKGTKVLITHGPPVGILDGVPRAGGRFLQHVGCQKLRSAVMEIRPKIHIFGHIHPGFGHESFGSTDFYNVALLDDMYEMVNEPVVIEI